MSIEIHGDKRDPDSAFAALKCWYTPTQRAEIMAALQAVYHRGITRGVSVTQSMLHKTQTAVHR